MNKEFLKELGLIAIKAAGAAVLAALLAEKTVSEISETEVSNEEIN